MNQHNSSRGKRGTTLLEILVAIALLLIIFLFITGDLIQSSHAENVAATRSESKEAANYLLGVMRDDGNFWQTDWGVGPGGTDPCGTPWPAYTDSIASPSWHTAPACTPSGTNPGVFPDLANLAGTNVFQFMWNAQQQGADPNTATLTVWIHMNENGSSIYELQTTRTHLVTPVPGLGSAPTPTPTPTPTTSACTSNCSPTPTPTPRPSPTARPSVTPKPSPSPQGTFE